MFNGSSMEKKKQWNWESGVWHFRTNHDITWLVRLSRNQPSVVATSTHCVFGLPSLYPVVVPANISTIFNGWIIYKYGRIALWNAYNPSLGEALFICGLSRLVDKDSVASPRLCGSLLACLKGVTSDRAGREKGLVVGIQPWSVITMLWLVKKTSPQLVYVHGLAE